MFAQWMECDFVCLSRLKKSLRFSEDDDGVHPVVLGSMVFPPDCYDDENPWTPLTPKNTHTTNTPRMVSLHVLFICLLFPLVQCCLNSQSLFLFLFLHLTSFLLLHTLLFSYCLLLVLFVNAVTCYLVNIFFTQLEKQSSWIIAMLIDLDCLVSYQ